MTTAIPLGVPAEMSPRTKARLTAAFYLATLIAAFIAEGLISRRLVVYGNAATTGANIVANESLFQLGFTAYLIEMSCQIAMTLLFYDLLKPVSRSASLAAAAFGLIGCTIKTMSRLFFIAPLLILGSGASLGDFTAAQAQSLSLLLLGVNDHGAAIAMVFFGLNAVIRGWLVLRSTFLPRFLGVLTMISGAGWLVFLSQPLGYRLFTYVAPVALLGSLATIVWLFVYGVDEDRWRAQAQRAAASIWR